MVLIVQADSILQHCKCLQAFWLIFGICFCGTNWLAPFVFLERDLHMKEQSYALRRNQRSNSRDVKLYLIRRRSDSFTKYDLAKIFYWRFGLISKTEVEAKV